MNICAPQGAVQREVKINYCSKQGTAAGMQRKASRTLARQGGGGDVFHHISTAHLLSVAS